jgi:hypothetical protein
VALRGVWGLLILRGERDLVGTIEVRGDTALHR